MDISVLFSIMVASFYITTSNIQRFLIRHSCQHLLSGVFLIKAILMDARWYLIVLIVLICISMSNDVEHLLIYLLVFACLLRKCLFRSFAHDKSGLFWFLGLMLCDFHMYISDINPFSDIFLVNLFTHSIGCIFHFIIPFVLQNLLIWCSPTSFSFSFFASCAFAVIYKKNCQDQYWVMLLNSVYSI